MTNKCLHQEGLRLERDSRGRFRVACECGESGGYWDSITEAQNEWERQMRAGLLAAVEAVCDAAPGAGLPGAVDRLRVTAERVRGPAVFPWIAREVENE